MNESEVINIVNKDIHIYESTISFCCYMRVEKTVSKQSNGLLIDFYFQVQNNLKSLDWSTISETLLITRIP